MSAVSGVAALDLRLRRKSLIGYSVGMALYVLMVVALYPPCGDRCPQLVQGASVQVPYSAISGYTAASREAVVMWWKYVRRADGTLAPEGGMQSVNVRLD